MYWVGTLTGIHIIRNTLQCGLWSWMLCASANLTISHTQGCIIIADLIDDTISALIALWHGSIGIHLIDTTMYPMCIFPRLVTIIIMIWHVILFLFHLQLELFSCTWCWSILIIIAHYLLRLFYTVLTNENLFYLFIYINNNSIFKLFIDYHVEIAFYKLYLTLYIYSIQNKWILNHCQ